MKRSSASLSVCVIIRPQLRRAAGLLPSAARLRLTAAAAQQQRRRSTALSNQCEQCHVDS